MRLILQIFHKRNKLVGVVKCTDRVVKWGSDDQVNELYHVCFKHKTVELAEAKLAIGMQEKN